MVSFSMNFSRSFYFSLRNDVAVSHSLLAIAKLLYINDLIDDIKRCNCGIYVCSVYLGCNLYADDLMLVVVVYSKWLMFVYIMIINGTAGLML